MANLNEQIESKARSAGRQAADKAENFGSMIESTTHNLGERVGSALSDFSTGAEDYMDYTRSYVKSNPLQSILIAAATGVVVGSVLTMASRSRN